MDNSLFPGPESIHREILAELAKAKKKHPRQPKHVVSRAAIVNEEAGELIQLTIQYKYERKRYTRTPEEWRALMRKEAIQVAVTAIRFIENLK